MPSSRAGINLHPGKGARARPWRAIRDHLKAMPGECGSLRAGALRSIRWKTACKRPESLRIGELDGKPRPV